ncbi:MAG: hypothetical protein K2P49_01485, partial [Oscillospiraceae bacterium]|nr:hypothetical protein [Oscillospiraceae bacterium]
FFPPPLPQNYIFSSAFFYILSLAMTAIGGLEKRRKSSCAGTGARAFSARAGIWKEARYA